MTIYFEDFSDSSSNTFIVGKRKFQWDPEDAEAFRMLVDDVHEYVATFSSEMNSNGPTTTAELQNTLVVEGWDTDPWQVSRDKSMDPPSNRHVTGSRNHTTESRGRGLWKDLDEYARFAGECIESWISDTTVTNLPNLARKCSRCMAVYPTVFHYVTSDMPPGHLSCGECLKRTMVGEDIRPLPSRQGRDSIVNRKDLCTAMDCPLVESFHPV